MTDPQGAPLRPHIVWFGEAVPLIEDAAQISAAADFYIVVGTSLVVYPAAGLIHYVPPYVPKYVIDPQEVHAPVPNVKYVKEPASTGLKKVVDELLMVSSKNS
jgi:NAD-dependent deacetylase